MSASLPQGFPQPTQVNVIEIKQYPQYRAVTYTHTGDSRMATRVAFDPLYQHISTNQIAMTTPVEARYVKEGEQTEVSFLYSTPDMTPQTIDSQVIVRDTLPMTVVSIGVQGGYSWESYQQNLQKLKHWLAQHPEYEVVSPPRRLLYNSPMTPEDLKRSEVQIPIERIY
ncbi:heme-binding protein [Okeania sp.]|uniref:heme-binding protein n=1 Tax=Okeania sp. TaxID=3100323 RepID=UPI002B4ACB1E|nr:heme-binding protein [Okeania sp.]MEB3342131.1 heme-binding protein [Okeania sp.]